MFNVTIMCLRELNRGPLLLEATALPLEPCCPKSIHLALELVRSQKEFYEKSKLGKKLRPGREGSSDIKL